MSEAKLTYAVHLVSDSNAFGKSTYYDALSMLKDFAAAHEGEYLGPFKQHGVEYPEYALVKMTPANVDTLHDFCVAALHDPNQRPFVERVMGEVFDISLAEGIEIIPVEAAINKRAYHGYPI